MARKLRVQYAGAIYHVTVRGVEQRTIFEDDAERQRFIERLGEAVDAYGVRLYLFCLMTNHAHLLVETPHANLSAFMHQLQTAYTVYFNLRHGRHGHLVQGRFGAEPVQGDAYLLRLTRYIHLNPVFAGAMSERPLDVRRASLRRYPWSSYQGYAGLKAPFPFVDEAPVLAMMEVPARTRRVAYRRFVEAGMAETDEDLKTLLQTSAWGIGDGEFQERMRDLHIDRAARAKRSEDVSFRRLQPSVDVASVLAAVSAEFGVAVEALRRRQYDCVARAAAAYLLGRHAGLSQRDCAELLGMGTGASVSQHLKRLRERQAGEPTLRARIDRLSRNLGKG